MEYYYSNRDAHNRATLIINGIKIGRIHFRENDAWLNPYSSCRFKEENEIAKLGMRIEYNTSNSSFPVKLYIQSTDEEEIANSIVKSLRSIG